MEMNSKVLKNLSLIYTIKIFCKVVEYYSREVIPPYPAL